MSKHWEDKSQWMTNCPICYCAVTHQLRDYHIQYHENEIKIGRDDVISHVDTFNDTM